MKGFIEIKDETVRGETILIAIDAIQSVRPGTNGRTFIFMTGSTLPGQTLKTYEEVKKLIQEALQ